MQSEQTLEKFPKWLLKLLQSLRSDPDFNVDNYLDTPFLKKNYSYHSEMSDIDQDDKPLINPIFNEHKEFLEGIYKVSTVSTLASSKESTIPEDKIVPTTRSLKRTAAPCSPLIQALGSSLRAQHHGPHGKHPKRHGLRRRAQSSAEGQGEFDANVAAA